MPATYRADKDLHRRLRHAAWKGDVEMARQMLRRGAKLEATDQQGLRAYDYAEHLLPDEIYAGQQKGTKGKGKGGWRTVTLHPHPSAPPRHPSFTRTLTRTLTLAENPRVRQFWALIPLDGGTSVAR